MEYVIILVLNMGFLFNLDSSPELFLFLGLAMALTLLGYLIKGGSGAALGLLVGIILFFYSDGRLPF